jgi:hypothetical protein
MSKVTGIANYDFKNLIVEMRNDNRNNRRI